MRRLLLPGSALVGKLHGQVIVHGNDDVAIVFWQYQLIKMVDAVPEGWTNDQGARRVRRTDDGKHLT